MKLAGILQHNRTEWNDREREKIRLLLKMSLTANEGANY